ncbi:transposase, partial [Klebsiella pneumoniae]|nr:transposase [Klebsiella pneumoniae]
NLQCIQIEVNKLHQKIVAPSPLLHTLKEGAAKNGVHIEEIKANATSQSCYSCGRLNKRIGVAATRTNMVCEGFGRHYDTDENASSNIRK